MTAPGPCLVWMRGARGPSVQVWRVPPANLPAPAANILSRHPLTAAEAEMSLADLIARYPAPVERGEA